RHQVGEAILDETDDLAERLGGDQRAAELARDRDRHLDRLRLHPRLHAGNPRGDALQMDLDLFQRARHATVGFDLGLALGGSVAVAIGLCLGGSDLLRDLGRGRRPLALLLGSGEIRVEQEFRGRCHQYTSSSSARFLVSMISPLAARSLARLTSSACASSTSRRRTGPIAAMSSCSILAAREDMLVKKKLRTSSL